MSEDTKSQLLRLKELTSRTGILHEAQVLQLKNWPVAIFDNVVSVEIAVHTDRHLIEYSFVVSRKLKTSKDVEGEAGPLLESWVQSLLGDEWFVSISYRTKTAKNAKEFYVGIPRSGEKPHVPPQADLPAYAFKTAMTEFKRYRLDRDAASSVLDEDLPPIAPKAT